MASSEPSKTSLGRPKPPADAQRVATGTGVVPHTGAGVTTTSITTGAVKGGDKSPPFEFRGFDFFANRDFNELKNASRAYFAPNSNTEKHQRLPSTWLGDATPPSSPRPSDEGPSFEREILPAPGGGPAPTREKKIFGLKKSKFWCIIAIVALLLIVAIGVGVGVGVGRAVSHSSSGAAAVTGSSVSSSIPASSSSTPTTTTSSTSTTSSPATTSTGSTEGKIDCPAANGTTYQVPGSNKEFLRICGIDYSGGEAVDIKQVETESILDCMKNCAGTKGCTGCGWGYLDGDTGTEHRCWMKGSLKKSHEADINWAFAVLL
ncbi:hypothetical protein M426DRAFT_12204 [Hypoxylon sp. CI-4A]|nr:hypothetical protein M426DRAFT_12204 [Hypoxylon sp. CI-4A]